MDRKKQVETLFKNHKLLINRKNVPQVESNGIFQRYKYPILTAAHSPVFWRYDLDATTNPFLMERQGINAAFNAGAIQLDGKIHLVVRVEGYDRKSFIGAKK